jgi:hypothetical protein
MQLHQVLSLLVVILLTTGCGGGGGCDSKKVAFGLVAPTSCEAETPAQLIGKFLDTAGIDYETPTHKGKTNTNGEFTYLQGETVTFKIYGTTIGSTLGTSVVTPYTIAPQTGSTDFSINVLRFLQSVDSDNFSSNGISIPLAPVLQDPDFDKSIAEFSKAMSDKSIFLISISSALSHFKTTLNTINSQDNYTLNLSGKKIKAYPHGCKNGLMAFEISFSDNGGTPISGSDYINRKADGTCEAEPLLEEERGVLFPYADFKRNGFIFPCDTSICSLSQLNNTYSGTDDEGRQWTQVISHAKNSSKIISTKYIIVAGVTTCAHQYTFLIE